MQAPRQPVVLIVDDEENVLRSLRRLFRHEPFRTIVTTDPYEALSCLHEGAVAVLLTDQRMRGLDGDHLIARVRALDERVVCIRLTGYPDAEGDGEAGLSRAAAPPREAVFRTVDKPWDDEEILGAVREAIALYERRAAAQRAHGLEPALPSSPTHSETHERENAP
jgi:FixJ family two-component response regulator